MNKPTVLIILDGFGLRAEKKDNGIALASKKNWDHLLKTYPHTQIEASGPAVGLPQGIMGNSEVGHMNMGAGRIVYTGLSQIYQAIEEGSFEKNEALLQAMAVARKNNKAFNAAEELVHQYNQLEDLKKEKKRELADIREQLKRSDLTSEDHSQLVINLRELKDSIAVIEEEKENILERWRELKKQMPKFFPSIMLLDEIEEADRSLIGILLQVMDEARLTVSTPKKGRTVTRFHRTFIFMTSNVGMREI